MNCPQCTKQVEDGWISCPFCKADLPKIKQCSKCSNDLQPEWVSCPFCGQDDSQDSGGDSGINIGSDLVNKINQNIDSRSVTNVYHGDAPDSGSATKDADICSSCRGAIEGADWFLCDECGKRSHTKCKNEQLSSIERIVCDHCAVPIIKERELEIAREAESRRKREKEQARQEAELARQRQQELAVQMKREQERKKEAEKQAEKEKLLNHIKSPKYKLFKRIKSEDLLIVGSLAISPDSKTVVCGRGDSDFDYGLVSWELATAKEGVQRKAHDDIYLMDISADFDVLIEMVSNSIELYNAKDERKFFSYEIDRGEEVFHCVKLSPDQKTLAIAFDNGKVIILDIETKETVHVLIEGSSDKSRHYNDHYQIEFSPDGNLLATEGNDSNVELWDPIKGSLVCRFDDVSFDRVSSMSFSSDSCLLACSFLRWDHGEEFRAKNPIHVWDVINHRQLCVINEADGSKGSLGLAFAPFYADGSILASVHVDGSVRLWQTRLNTEVTEPIFVLNQSDARYDWKAGVVLSSDARYLVTATEEEICIWEME